MAKKDKDIEEAIELTQQEQDMQDLVGVLKSEMDDAKDFISQVGQERAESTEYYLGNEPESTSTLQSEFISTDVRDTVLFMLPQIMRTFLVQKRWWSLYLKGLKILP